MSRVSRVAAWSLVLLVSIASGCSARQSATSALPPPASVAATAPPAPASPAAEAAKAYAYPPAAKGDVVDDYNGTRVPDPYRWLEKADDPATTAWVAAENSLTPQRARSTRE
jgi:prolyl oligopeptidase